MRVFHGGLSDSKSAQVSRTLFSILADLNNTVVWTVLTRPVISKSSSLCTNPLVTVRRAPITIGRVVNFRFHSFLNSLARSTNLSLFSHSFNFTLWSSKVHNSASSLFFVDYYKVWSSDRDYVIRLYLEIPDEFVRLILQDRF